MYKKIIEKSKQFGLSYGYIVAATVRGKLNPEEVYKQIQVTPTLAEFRAACARPPAFTFEQIKKECESLGMFSGGFYSDILNQIISSGDVYEFLENQTFENKEEIESLCKQIIFDYLHEDLFLNEKFIADQYGNIGVSFSSQMKGLVRKVGAAQKWIIGTANEYWFGKNALQNIEKRTQTLLTVERTKEKYESAKKDLQENFGVTELDCEMFRYFICQSRDGDCPASLNKALYIWGEGKGTGKTTIAGTLICILNGEKLYTSGLASEYKSCFANEFLKKEFVAPLICSTKAVMLDEAMPKDSEKSYNLVKERITSDGARIRFVYSNERYVPCKANYIFTSNENPTNFIQDDSDRRFFQFRIEKKHRELSFDKIYNLFLNFAQQCKREQSWSDWYNGMMSATQVLGLEYFEKIDIRNEILNEDLYNILKNSNKSEFIVGDFFPATLKLVKKPTRQLFKQCLIDIFGDDEKKSRWSKRTVFAVYEKTQFKNVFEKN